MNAELNKQVLELICSTWKIEDNIHLLAVAVREVTEGDIYYGKATHRVRLAITLQDHDGINPYFDGTDIWIERTENGVQFAVEEDWADGPPLTEGSPIEMAVGWVTQLETPIYASAEAQSAANASLSQATPLQKEVQFPHHINPEDTSI